MTRKQLVILCFLIVLVNELASKLFNGVMPKWLESLQRFDTSGDMEFFWTTVFSVFQIQSIIILSLFLKKNIKKTVVCFAVFTEITFMLLWYATFTIGFSG